MVKKLSYDRTKRRKSLKRNFKIFVMVIIACLCGVLIAGCDGSLSVKQPKITCYGNVVFWDEVEGADSYLVNVGEEQKEVFTNYYICDNLSVSQQVYVRTKAGEKVSKKSNTVSVIKTTGFAQDESYGISLTDQKTYDILPSYNYVKISGSASGSQIKIQNRTRDLVIELNDVTLAASQGHDCIATLDGKYDTSELNFDVVFIVNGSNKITGSNYSTTPSKQPENSGKYGVRGGDGGNGIVLPNVVVTGQGSLSVYGGKGGNGGDGADSSGMSTSSNGSGGNGGNGGSGVLCSNFIMATGVDGIVKLYGGDGGNGGKKGKNGSIMSGPWVDIAQSRKDGDAGSNGKSYVGNLLRLSGTFN